MKLACPICGPQSWSVQFTGERWEPSGQSAWSDGPVDMIAGRCSRCMSMVLFDATPVAAEFARRRLAAARALREVAADG